MYLVYNQECMYVYGFGGMFLCYRNICFCRKIEILFQKNPHGHRRCLVGSAALLLLLGSRGAMAAAAPRRKTVTSWQWDLFFKYNIFY